MVKFKLCGLTNVDDYNAAVELGAAYTGFIFYPRSARCILPDKAKKVIEQGGQGTNLKVGVFVDEDIERIRMVYAEAGLDIVQLHGEESPEYCLHLELPYWKVIRVKDARSLDQMGRYSCSTFLLDTFSDKEYGGTGIAFDLEIVAKAVQTGKKIIIAGGISAANVEPILRLKPFAVDVNSSVEIRPGQKSVAKMQEFSKKIKDLQAGKNEI